MQHQYQAQISIGKTDSEWPVRAIQITDSSD